MCCSEGRDKNISNDETGAMAEKEDGPDFAAQTPEELKFPPASGSKITPEKMQEINDLCDKVRAEIKAKGEGDYRECTDRIYKEDPEAIKKFGSDQYAKDMFGELYDKVVGATVDEDMVTRVTSRHASPVKELPDLKIPPKKRVYVQCIDEMCDFHETFKHPENCDCSYCQPVAPSGGPCDEECLEHPFAEAELMKGVNEVTYRKTTRGDWEPDMPNVEHLYTPEQQQALYNYLIELRPGIRKHVENPDQDECSTYDIFMMCEEWRRKQAMEEEVAAQEIKKDDSPLKGMVIFYVDIGTLSPDKVEDFLLKFRKKHCELTSRFPSGYEPMFLPVRNQGTQVVIMEFPREDATVSKKL